jgi:hypothetical protein
VGYRIWPAALAAEREPLAGPMMVSFVRQ